MASLCKTASLKPGRPLIYNVVHVINTNPANYPKKYYMVGFRKIRTINGYRRRLKNKIQNGSFSFVQDTPYNTI